jgi:predicted dehydrogenase
MTGLQRRLAPHNRYLRELLAEGYVGRLRSPRLHVSMNYFQPRLPNALSWTVPLENFSSMVAIYVGHFLDMLFKAIGWPTCVSALTVNHFPKVTIIETGKEIETTNADEFVLAATLPDDAVVSAYFEGASATDRASSSTSRELKGISASPMPRPSAMSAMTTS